METEKWRDIPDYVGEYQVSDQGRVRSLPGGNRHAKVLKPQKSGRTGNTYLFVALRGRDQKSIHRLVALVFIGPPPFEQADVCHNNGDRFDNRAENLRWDTRTANAMDRNDHGTNYWSNRTHCKNGHEYTPENTRVTPTRRWCRACDRERWARMPHPRKSAQR